MKEEILKLIADAITKTSTARNSMGCSESYYNKYYSIGECFTENELLMMNEIELNNLLKLAEFLSDAFY